MTASPAKAPFVTFYSFKGGVGRSMALVNVAALLADRGFRILLIDMDLEAPGISYLVDEPGGESKPGVVDVLLDAVERGTAGDLFTLTAPDLAHRYSHRLPTPQGETEDGSVALMPAGRLGAEYQGRLDRLALGALYRDGVGRPLIARWKETIQRSGVFDYVFVDSRTGFADESGICTRDLADHLVVLMGLNRQNIEGTAEFFRALTRDGGTKSVRVVLSPMPLGEDSLRAEREEAAAEALRGAVGKPVELRLRIPYHPRLALTEEISILTLRGTALHEAYLKLEEAIRDMVGLSPTVLAAQVTTAATERKPELFVQRLEFLRRVIGKSPGYVAATGPALALLRDDVSAGIRGRVAEILRDDAAVLGVIGLELHQAKAADPAVFYELALEAAPNDPAILGNFANFLGKVPGEYDRARKLYERAMEADPGHANNLGNFANFLWQVRSEHDRAQELYERAMEADPGHANNLGNFANFLWEVRGDHDRAQRLYERAIEADPGHANSLGNFANFLWEVRGDHDRAQGLYERAIEADPGHANSLGNFANFLCQVRGEQDRAQGLYEEAIEVDPVDAVYLGNFAAFWLARGKPASARPLLDRAKACLDSAAPDSLPVELSFYDAVLAPPDQIGAALQALAVQVRSGARSPGWPFREIVEANADHLAANLDLFRSLAAVCADEAPASSLDGLPGWPLPGPGAS